MLDFEETELNQPQNASKPADEEETHGKFKWSTSLKKTLSNEEIVAQAILFQLGGFETTSTTTCFTIYHLAMYPQYQQRLFEEVDKALEQNVSLAENVNQSKKYRFLSKN